MTAADEHLCAVAKRNKTRLQHDGEEKFLAYFEGIGWSEAEAKKMLKIAKKEVNAQ